MVPGATTPNSKESIRIFVSYAREDKDWLDPNCPNNLVPFLEDSLRKQNVVFWYDKTLKPGDVFSREIEEQIDRSQIALLVVSQSFLNSDYIEQKELPRIGHQAKLGQLVIVPVLVERCKWSKVPILAERQMVPAGKPLIDYTVSKPEWKGILADILDGIESQVDQIREMREEARLELEREYAAKEKARLEAAALEKARKDAEEKARLASQSRPVVPPAPAAWNALRSQVLEGAKLEVSHPRRQPLTTNEKLAGKLQRERAKREQLMALLESGDLDSAITLCVHQEQICRERGDNESLLSWVTLHVSILQDRGDIKGALALNKEQERICRDTGNNQGLADCLYTKADLLLKHPNRLKRMGLAKVLEEHQNLCRDIGDEEGLAKSLASYASVLSKSAIGRILSQEQLQEQLAEAEEIATRNGFQDILDFIHGIRESTDKK
jgi:hypothetical protein